MSRERKIEIDKIIVVPWSIKYIRERSFRGV